MLSQIQRLILAMLLIAVLVLGLFGCVPGAAVQGKKVKVGLSFSDFATERWKNEDKLMRRLLEEKGYQVISQEANHDVQLQNDQIKNMVAQGVKALIIVAEDGDAIVPAVNQAAQAGVKVLAYDRLIKSSNIAAYLSFNNVEVGREQAQGVINALQIERWDVAARGKARLVLLGGSLTDNNASLVRKGQEEVLAKYADKVEIAADQWVVNWSAANALADMERILNEQKNKVDGVVASNDNIALGALQALRAQQLAGKVPISGQDATADACNMVAKGEMTVTIFKDIRTLSPLAVDLADKLLKSQPISGLEKYSLADLTNDKTRQGEVYAYFLPVKQVNKDNVLELVVKSGYQSYEDVYRDVPANQRPPKP